MAQIDPRVELQMDVWGDKLRHLPRVKLQMDGGSMLDSRSYIYVELQRERLRQRGEAQNNGSGSEQW